MGVNARDYSATSYWLETCGDDLTPRAPLDGSIRADVAILGAGYSGLWTAYYLLLEQPDLNVVLIEEEIAGFGASGRNGGWCSPYFSLTPAGLRERYGVDAGRRVVQALFETIDEVGRVVEAENIDAHYAKGGALRIARGEYQRPSVESAYENYQKLGLGDHFHLLTKQELEERIRVNGAVSALYTPECAVIHPGRLVRGLARAVERRGGTIYEQTPVTDFQPGPKPVLTTPRGRVEADTIVLAGEAYLGRLRPLHRQLIPVYSLIVLTEPLGDKAWQEIGWEARECVASSRFTVDYLSKTVDGRILFGGRGAPYRLGARIDEAMDRHEPTHAKLREMVTQWFPSLKGVAFTHAWGGPLGVPRDWTPTIAYDRATGVATARGYVGQGVSTSNLAGRALAHLILGHDTPWTQLPFIGHRSPNWEPEPFRWLGVRFVQEGMQRIDEEGERTGRPPTGRSLAERLARH